MKKKKFRLIIFLLILLISIGFAYLSTNLSLFGTGIFKQNSWDIYFDNITEETYKSEVIGTTEIDNKTTINFSVNLDGPGSTYTMYANIVNDGSIDAMLDSWNLTNTMDEDEAKAIEVSVTYSDGVEFTKNDLLKAKSLDTIKVVVTYKKDISNSELLTSSGDLDFSFTMNYVQADEDVREREHYFIRLWPELTSLSYDRNTGDSTFNVIGTPSRWEIFYNKLHLVSGDSYSLTVNYNIPADYHNLNSSFLGIGIQLLSDVPDNTSNSASQQIVRSFMETSAGDYSSTVTFTATDNNYLVFNGGYALDNENCSFKIKNIILKRLGS